MDMVHTGPFNSEVARKEETLRNVFVRSSHCGAAGTNPTRNHEVAGSIPGLAQWVRDPALL